MCIVVVRSLELRELLHCTPLVKANGIIGQSSEMVYGWLRVARIIRLIKRTCYTTHIL